MQPGPGQRPIAFHRSPADIQVRGNFLLGQAAEKAQFHYLGLAGRERRQTMERLIQMLHHRTRLIVGQQHVFEGQIHLAGTALQGPVLARVVGEDAAHDAGCHGKEVGAILPAWAALSRQLEVRFVNQGRGLQGMAGPLRAQVPRSQTLEIAIDTGNQIAFR